jgi:hypothetical protein
MNCPFNVGGIIPRTSTNALPVGGNLAPLQGVSRNLILFPALKRRANFSRPFGAIFGIDLGHDWWTTQLTLNRRHQFPISTL